MKNFHRFCDPVRECASEPFLRPDGFLYATDGRIVVRCRPSLDADFKEMEITTESAWETVDWDQLQECEFPSGFDPFQDHSGPCAKCEGTGGVECQYHHTHECPDCMGSGILENHRCIPVRLRDGSIRVFHEKRARLALQMPGCLFWATEHVGSPGVFRWEDDGIACEGLLMPASNESLAEIMRLLEEWGDEND